MGRQERTLAVTDEISAFAADLRKLRASAGGTTYRELAARTHYSHTTLTDATAGKQLPSLPVLLAFVDACRGDAEAWRCRWERLRTGQDGPVTVLPAWPEQPTADGSEPEAAGCAGDATTITARKIGRTDRRLVLGQIELRHSPSRGAVWGRFEGFGSLEHLARCHNVEIQVEVVRLHDGACMSLREPFCFDYQWSDILLLHDGPVRAQAAIYVDDELVAEGATPPWPGSQ